ncbi:zinc finger protein-like [Tropilaelaps mercedesae]|uniref:Zinc finger protein-like n=1 Tax=Tropilaelaps mercedesae TaxID=418985 RepID=A0A1V9X9X7_9ACAR|nr:zinc finger protein-like [Tropilaelaps mercedesae]
MKRAELMAARIETRYERSRSQARRERRSRTRSRSRPRTPSHRGGGYRPREKSRGRSRSRRASPRNRTPPDARTSYRHRSKSTNRHPRSDSAGRHLSDRDRSLGPYRRNGRVSRFDQPDGHRGRSRSRSGRSPVSRRTPPTISPFKVGRTSPEQPPPRDTFSTGALSRFEAPPSPKRDSLSPTAPIADVTKPPKKNADPKSQAPPGVSNMRLSFSAEDLYEGISNDSMMHETSRKFLNATFRPIESAHHSKESVHPRRPPLDSPVNSIFPEVAPMELLSNSAGPGRGSQGLPSQQREMMDRLDRAEMSASEGRPHRADGPDSEVALSSGRDGPHQLTVAEERYLEIVKLRENIRRAEQSIAAEASKRSLRPELARDRDEFSGTARGDQARLERRESERTWEQLGPGGAADHVRRLPSPHRSFPDDRIPERKDLWRTLEDNALTSSRQPGPPSARSNISGTGYGRLTPPLADAGRVPFSSSTSSVLPGIDGHRDPAVRIPGLSTIDDNEYMYLLSQQQRLSPAKRLASSSAVVNDANSQATSASVPSVRDGPARGGPGVDREDWLREIDELKRQLREKEELAREYRNLPSSTTDKQHSNRPLSPRSGQDFEAATFRSIEHGSAVRREADQHLQGRHPMGSLVRRSPVGRMSPGERRSPRRRTRSPSLRSKRSPTYRRRSRSPYSRRSPVTRRSPLDDRTMDRDAYVRAMTGYHPPRHDLGSSVRDPGLAVGFHGATYIPANTQPPAVTQLPAYGGVSAVSLAGSSYYGQPQSAQPHTYYPYGVESYGTDPRSGYAPGTGTHGLVDHLSHSGSAQGVGGSTVLAEPNKMLERGPEMTNLRTLTCIGHGKKSKRKGKDTCGEALANDGRTNPPAFAEVDVGLQPVDMDLEEEDEVVGGIAVQPKEQPPPVSSRPEEKYAQEIESYLKLTNEKDAEKERLSILKQEMSRIGKLQADLLRLRKAAPDDAHVGRQLANTGKLYEEAKKKATGVGKQIDALGQDIFKIPQKIKLLAMEHEHKFREKIEAIKNASKEKNKAATSGGNGQTKKDVRFKYVDRGEFFCSYCRTEFRSVASFLAHLHTELHIANSNQAQEKPWASLESAAKISAPMAATCNVPAKGGQFIMGIMGFYCKICRSIFPDSPTAEKHVLSEEHNLKYKEYIGMNPFYERRVQLEKETILHSIAKATAPRQTKQSSSSSTVGGNGNSPVASGKSRSAGAEPDDRKPSAAASGGHSKRSSDDSGTRSSRESRDPSKSYRTTSAGKAESASRLTSGGSFRGSTKTQEQNSSSAARQRKRTSSKDSDRDTSTGSLDQINETNKKIISNNLTDKSRSPSPRITSTTENSQKSGGIRLKLLKPSCGGTQPLMIGKAPFKRKPSVDLMKDSPKANAGGGRGASSAEQSDGFAIGAPPSPPGDDEPMLPMAMGPLKAPEPVEEAEPAPPGETAPPSEVHGWPGGTYPSWNQSAPVPLVPEADDEGPEEDELEEY